MDLDDYILDQVRATGIVPGPFETLDQRLSALEKEFRAVFGKAETAEPAPCSDAEHPPVGYVLVPRNNGEVIAADWIIWSFDEGPWTQIDPPDVGVIFRSPPYHPCARPIPANEGDSRLAESFAIPVGWVACGQTAIGPGKYREHGGQWITPDPSIPWGEGYEEILPSEARNGGSCEFWADDTRKRWIPAERVQTWDERCRNQYAWRRRIPVTTPTEPVRDLSAEVERLEEWQEAGLTASMMWDVIQEMRKTLDCDGTTTPVERAERVMRTVDELRATVEMLEAELETTKRLLAESLVERDRLKNLHDARKVRIEGFRDVLRERLGDLV